MISQESVWKAYEESLPKPAAEYKIGNIVLKEVPKDQESEALPKPDTPPPQVFTTDAKLASIWHFDEDGPDTAQKYPAYTIPINDNIISILTISTGKHVLILQLRRMAVIGHRLFDLLYNRDVCYINIF